MCAFEKRWASVTRVRRHTWPSFSVKISFVDVIYHNQTAIIGSRRNYLILTRFVSICIYVFLFVCRWIECLLDTRNRKWMPVSVTDADILILISAMQWFLSWNLIGLLLFVLNCCKNDAQKLVSHNRKGDCLHPQGMTFCYGVTLTE